MTLEPKLGPSADAFGARGGAPDDDLNLRDLFRMIWRRKLLIFGCIAAITIPAATFVSTVTPRYEAAAYVMIDPRRPQVVKVDDVMSSLPADEGTIEGEMQVIRSRQIALATIAALKLDVAREAEKGGGLFGWFSATPTGDAGKDATAVPGSPPALTWFLSSLSISQEGKSRVIRIAFQDTDPVRAAAIVNTHADEYLRTQLDSKLEATEIANRWLNERLNELREQALASEEAVSRLRAENDIVALSGDRTLHVEELAEINILLTRAKARTTEARSRLEQMEAQIKRPLEVVASNETLNSTIIQRLREAHAQLLREAAELATTYGDRHPRMANVRAEIVKIEEDLGVEIAKVLQALRNEYAVARTAEAGLLRRFDALKGEINDKSKASVQLRSLELEAATSRALFETFLTRYKEIANQNNLQQPDARIISRADPPETPSYPNKPLLLFLAFVASTVLGFILAFLVEHLDEGLRSMEEVEKVTGKRPMGLIPRVRGFDPKEQIVDKPASAYSQAIRNLYTNVLLSDVERPIKVVAFTSSAPNEGKSSICVSLGMSLVGIGRKAIVVDFDLKRPSVHDIVDLPLAPGVAEYLRGDAPLGDIIRRDHPTGVHFLTGGALSMADNPFGGRFGLVKKLLQALSETYDFVIVDTSPVLAVPDTKVIARLVDRTVFIVKWADTRRAMVTMALNHLEESGGDVAGVLLTHVDPKRHAQYGYGDSGSYYGPLRKYYVD